MPRPIILLAIAVIFLGGVYADPSTAETIVKGKEGTIIILGRDGGKDDDKGVEKAGDDEDDDDDNDSDDEQDDDDEQGDDDERDDDGDNDDDDDS